MSPVTGVGATSAVPLAGPAAPGAPSDGTLLPAPAADIAVTDALTKLLQMSAQLGEQQTMVGKAGVEAAENRRKAASEKRKEALARAAEAAREAREGGGFFSFITDNVGLTGLIGLATFNVGLVAADITAHKTGLAGKGTNGLDVGAALLGGPLGYLAAQGVKKLAPEGMGQTSVAAAMLGGPMGYAIERAADKMIPDDFAKEVEELTTVEDDDVRLANKVALTVALAAVAATSTVVTGGTSAPVVVALVGIGISTATQVASDTGALEAMIGEKAAMYVALGGAITGAALTLGGSAWSALSGAAAAAELDSAARTTARAAGAAKQVTEGAANVTSGVQSFERAGHQHDADMARADAQEQKHVLQRIEAVVDAILDDLKEAKESSQRAAETIQSTLQSNNQTLLLAGSMKV